MPPPEVLRALLAGLIAGATTAFASTTILLIALQRGATWFNRAPATGVPMPLVGVVLMNGFLLGWTALGLVLGAGAYALEQQRPADGLLSPNLSYTLVVAGSTLAALAGARFVRGRLAWPLAAMGITAALVFGWGLPWLAIPGR